MNNRQDAEKCVNGAYLGAWNAIPPAHPDPLLSYIVKIVRNVSLKSYWVKEAAKRSGHYTTALDEYLAEHFVAVWAKYYAEHDHTKTFLDDGYTEQYFYLTQDTKSGE